MLLKTGKIDEDQSGALRLVNYVLMLASLLTSYSDITIFKVGNDRGTFLEACGLGRIEPQGFARIS
jgi:hypothetical protein